MTSELVSTSKSLVIIAGAWLVSFAINFAAGHVMDSVVMTESVMLIIAALAFYVADRLRARAAMFVLAVSFASMAAIMLLRTIFGVPPVRGGNAHLTVFAAALIGTALGAFVMKRWSRA